MSSINIGDFLTPETVQSDEDRRLVVRFSMEPRLDSAKTAQEGREVYRDVEFVTILIPGDKTLTVHRPVQPSDRARFPVQYAAFKNSQGDAVVGTPLSAWPYIQPTQRKELEYFNIRTVEQLAEVADSSAQNFHGLQALKQAAKKFVEASKATAPIVAMQKELESRDAAIADLKARLDALAADKPAKAKAAA